MKPSIRNTAVVLSAAAVSAAVVVGSARANYWSLFSNPTAQNSQPAPAAAAPAANGDPPLQLAANGWHYRDGSYTGPIVDSYYGQVQVQANIRGNRLESVDVLQYPADRRASRSINDRALPILESEVISSQNSRVNIVSGATLTSAAYLRSLNNALGQAGS